MSIPIHSIRVDPQLQPRLGGVDSSHVAELEHNPAAWPPLAVVSTSSGYLLVDGFHRLAAAQNLGSREVDARVLTMPEDGDLRGLAFTLNAAHGMALTLNDRKAEAARNLHRDPAISNMEVARSTALSPTTVQGIREQLEREAVIERVPQRVSATGVTYTPPSAVRQLGELPQESFADLIDGTVGVAFTSAERRTQRKIARYLERLLVALCDIYELDGWPDDAAAASACVAVLGPERASELGAELGIPARVVLELAERLAPGSSTAADQS